MAPVILGAATSHGPLLGMEPTDWPIRGEADRKHTGLVYRGVRRDFDALVELRRAEELNKVIAPDVIKSRFDACQSELDWLAGELAEAQPDVMIVIGDDQEELFFADNMPAFLIYRGAQMDHIPPTPEQVDKMGAGMKGALTSRYPSEAMTHPGHPELADRLIAALIAEGFDVSVSDRFPAGSHHDHGVPHAFGFVYTRLLRNQVVANVPIFINTFYPPNQPSVQRCYELGRHIGRAAHAWPSSARIALVASGGLSHFVVDEELDHDVLDALRNDDLAALQKIPEEFFTSGSSEIKNWIALAGAMHECGLAMDQSQYVACYRSLAGTGSGMGFATWK